MMSKLHGIREPLFHISKRDECGFLKACLIRLAAIALALVVCAIVIYSLTGLNPVEVYRGIIDGAVGSNRRLWVTIRDALALLCIAVAITPAFRMRFWNIGAEGQTLIGGLATAAVMINLADRVPNPVLLLLMLLAAVAAGLIWGLIPAIFKAQWNTNETLFTLMMNYIASQLVAFCIVFWENPAGSNSVGIINQASRAGWFPPLFGLNYGWNLVIVLALTAFVRRVIIRTMAISGAICGVAGFVLVGGAGHTISTGIADGRGFTAIVVAWLSKLNTFTMMFVSFLLTFMEKGAIQIASQFNLSENASDIITGIILFFVLGCEFFINYKVEFRYSKKGGHRA